TRSHSGRRAAPTARVPGGPAGRPARPPAVSPCPAPNSRRCVPVSRWFSPVLDSKAIQQLDNSAGVDGPGGPIITGRRKQSQDFRGRGGRGVRPPVLAALVGQAGLLVLRGRARPTARNDSRTRRAINRSVSVGYPGGPAGAAARRRPWELGSFRGSGRPP